MGSTVTDGCGVVMIDLLGGVTGTPVHTDVGSVMVLTGAATTNKDHVVVIGHFSGGSEQVISDTFV